MMQAFLIAATLIIPDLSHNQTFVAMCAPETVPVNILFWQKQKREFVKRMKVRNSKIKGTG